RDVAAAAAGIEAAHPGPNADAVEQTLGRRSQYARQQPQPLTPFDAAADDVGAFGHARFRSLFHVSGHHRVDDDRDDEANDPGHDHANENVADDPFCRATS